MKQFLLAQDFELEYLDGNSYKYFCYNFTFNDDTYEICIEPNKHGYQVAHYDANGILCGSRVNVEPVSGEMPHDMFKRACRIADMMYGVLIGRANQHDSYGVPLGTSNTYELQTAWHIVNTVLTWKGIKLKQKKEK